MLENFIAATLQKYLSEYFEEIDLSKFQVQVLGGRIKLSHLRLKPTALQNIHPGVVITGGTIGRLVLTFSLLRLSSEPVVAEISDVHIFIQGVVDASMDPLFVEQHAKRLFQRKLELAFEAQNLFEQQMEAIQKQQQSKNPLQSNFLQHLLQNLRVTIKGLRINFRDDQIGVQLGVGVDSISVTPQAVMRPKTVHKRIELKGIQIHHQDVSAKQKDLSFIVNPFDTHLDLILDASTQPELRFAQTSISVDVERFNLNLSSLQALQMLQVFTKYKSLQLRLSGYARRKANPSPRDRLIYLVSTALDDTLKVRDKHEFRSYMKLFCAHYIRMKTIGAQRLTAQLMGYSQYPFCSTQPCFCLHAEQNQRMHCLHKILSLQDINLARRMVLTYLISNRCNYDTLAATSFEFDLNETGLRYLMHEQMKWTTILSSKTEFLDGQTKLDIQVHLHNTSVVLHNALDVSLGVRFKETTFSMEESFSKSSTVYAELQGFEASFHGEVLCTSTPGCNLLDLMVCTSKENEVVTCDLKLGNMILSCGSAVFGKLIALIRYDYSNLLAVKHLLLKVLAFEQVQIPRTHDIIQHYRQKLDIQCYAIIQNVKLRIQVEKDIAELSLDKLVFQLFFKKMETTCFIMLSGLGFHVLQDKNRLQCFLLDETTVRTEGQHDVRLQCSVRSISVNGTSTLIGLLYKLTSALSQEEIDTISKLVSKTISTLAPVAAAYGSSVRGKVRTRYIILQHVSIDCKLLKITLSDETRIILDDIICILSPLDVSLRSFECVSGGVRYYYLDKIGREDVVMRLRERRLAIGKLVGLHDPLWVSAQIRKAVFGDNRFEQLKEMLRLAVQIASIIPAPAGERKKNIEVIVKTEDFDLQILEAAGVQLKFMPLSEEKTQDPRFILNLGHLQLDLSNSKPRGYLESISLTSPGHLDFHQHHLSIEAGELYFKEPLTLRFTAVPVMLRSLVAYLYFTVGDILDIAMGFDVALPQKKPQQTSFPTRKPMSFGLRADAVNVEFEHVGALKATGLRLQISNESMASLGFIEQELVADVGRVALNVADVMLLDADEQTLLKTSGLRLQSDNACAGIRYLQTTLSLEKLQSNLPSTLLNRIARKIESLEKMLLNNDGVYNVTQELDAFKKLRYAVLQNHAVMEDLALARNTLFRDPISGLVRFGNFINRRKKSILVIEAPSVRLHGADIVNVAASSLEVIYTRFKDEKEVCVKLTALDVSVLGGNALRLDVPQLNLVMGIPQRNVVMRNQKIELNLRLGSGFLEPKFLQAINRIVSVSEKLSDKGLYLACARRALEKLQGSSSRHSTDYIVGIIAAALADPFEQNVTQRFSTQLGIKMHMEAFNIVDMQLSMQVETNIVVNKITHLNTGGALMEHLFEIGCNTQISGTAESKNILLVYGFQTSMEFSDLFQKDTQTVRKRISFIQPSITVNGHVGLNHDFLQKVVELYVDSVRSAELSGRKPSPPKVQQSTTVRIQGLYLIPSKDELELRDFALHSDIKIGILQKLLLNAVAKARLSCQVSPHAWLLVGDLAIGTYSQLFDGNPQQTLVEDLSLKVKAEQSESIGCVIRVTQKQPTKILMSPELAQVCAELMADIYYDVEATMDRFRVTHRKQIPFPVLASRKEVSLTNATRHPLRVGDAEVQVGCTIHVQVNTLAFLDITALRETCVVTLPENKWGRYTRPFQLADSKFILRAFQDDENVQHVVLSQGVLLCNRTSEELCVDNIKQIKPGEEAYVDSRGAYMQLSLGSGGDAQIVNLDSTESDWLSIGVLEVYLQVEREDGFVALTLKPALVLKNLFPGVLIVNGLELGVGQTMPISGFIIDLLRYGNYSSSNVQILKGSQLSSSVEPQKIMLQDGELETECLIQLFENEARVIPQLVVLNTIQGARVVVRQKRNKPYNGTSIPLRQDIPEPILFETNSKMRISLLNRELDIPMDEYGAQTIKKQGIGLVCAVKPYAQYCKWVTIYPHRYIVNQVSVEVELFLPQVNESFRVPAAGRMQILQLFDLFIVRVQGKTTRQFTIAEDNPLQSDQVHADAVEFITVVQKNMAELKYIYITEKAHYNFEFINRTGEPVLFIHGGQLQKSLTHVVAPRSSSKYLVDEAAHAFKINLFNTPVDLARVGDLQFKFDDKSYILQNIVGTNHIQAILRDLNEGTSKNDSFQVFVHLVGFELVIAGANNSTMLVEIKNVSLEYTGSPNQTMSTVFQIESASAVCSDRQKPLLKKQIQAEYLLVLSAKTVGFSPTFESIDVNVAPVQVNCDRETIQLFTSYFERLRNLKEKIIHYPIEPLMMPIQNLPILRRLYFQHLKIRPIYAIVTVHLSDLDLATFGVRSSAIIRYLQSINLIDAKLGFKELNQFNGNVLLNQLISIFKGHLVRQAVGNAGKIFRAVNRSDTENTATTFKEAAAKYVVEEEEDLLTNETGSTHTAKRQKLGEYLKKHASHRNKKD